MDPNDLVSQANRILSSSGRASGVSVLAEAKEFLRVYVGERSAFLRQLNEVDQTWTDDYIKEFVRDVLSAFIRYAENDLVQGLSPQRQAQIDVVSDLLA